MPIIPNVQIPGSVACMIGGVAELLRHHHQRRARRGSRASSSKPTRCSRAASPARVERHASPARSAISTPKYKSYIGPTGDRSVGNSASSRTRPKWTLAGTLAATCRWRRATSTRRPPVSYRSMTHQFEMAEPVPRPAGLYAVGREPDLQLRVERPVFDRGARQEPHRRALQDGGLSVSRRQRASPARSSTRRPAA